MLSQTDDYAEVVLSAFDCILGREETAIYASSPITTGPRLHKLLREHGFQDSDELKNALGEAEYRRLVIQPNITQAQAFAHELRQRFGRTTLVVSPGPLVVPEWSQAQYLRLWEALIRTRISQAYFDDGWQYSNGCTFEFSVAWATGVPTLTAAGEPLGLEHATSLVLKAIDELQELGLTPAGLEANFMRMKAAGDSQPVT